MSQRPGDRLTQAIREVRRERVALVAFITAGFPSMAKFRDDLTTVAEHADVVEIGVPFTDPMADGVTIQRSSTAALQQGVTLHWIIDELAKMPRVKAPLVLMSYMNPLLAYGLAPTILYFTRRSASVSPNSTVHPKTTLSVARSRISITWARASLSSNSLIRLST